VEQSEGDLLDTLEAELNIWRKTPFDQLIRRREHLPALVAAVRHARGDDQKQVRLQDMWALLSAAVPATEAVGSAADSKGRVSNPAVIREVFGLTAHSKNASVLGRLNHAGAATGQGIAGHTMRRNLDAFVDQLATWIREYLDQQRRAAEVAPVAETSLLVARDDDLAWLHATYRDLVQRGGGVFQLWGIAGVGKTTLATQFAGQIGPEKVIGIIHVGRRGLFEDDLRRVLGLEGHDTSAWSDEYCEARFRAVVFGRLRSIRLLVFDGVDDPSDVIALVPKGVTVPLLITSRERLRFTGDASEQLKSPAARRIMTFSREQSTQLLRQYLADLDDETVEDLAEVVGGHPESLMHIARYVELNLAISVTDLLEELHRQPRQTLIDLTEALGVPSCAAVAVEGLFRRLDRSSLAYAIIICLIWTDEMGQQPRPLMLELVTIFRNERPSELAMRAALGQLERLGLLGLTEDSIHMSRMTCQVLRDLTTEEVEPVLVAYERLIAVPVAASGEKSLLNKLRQDYDFTRSLHSVWARWMSNEDTPLPAFVCVDRHDWAFFATTKQGRRRASLYRVTPGALQQLHPDRGRWETISDEKGLDVILRATRLYYNAILDGLIASREARESRGISWEGVKDDE